MDVAAFDKECFEKGTDPSKKWNNNLWEVWDTDHDGKVQPTELARALQSMDLDGDGDPTNLEIAAYLTRNQYILCRPIRILVFRELDKLIKKKTMKLFKFLDADKDRKINDSDPQKLF